MNIRVLDNPEVPHYISLGAGVQSSVLALMSAHGELSPTPKAAIFCDTQAEPREVYTWLDYLETQLPFPVYRVTAGSLRETELRIMTSKKSGKRYTRNRIPAYVLKPTGSIGLLGRKCTRDYKIYPFQRKVRELLGIRRGGKDLKAVAWIGISTDEAHRMKPGVKPYIKSIWPLIDVGMSRQDCLVWMQGHGYPLPPRSACTFCPFHSDMEWQRLKTDSLEEFQEVVEFERLIQEAHTKQELLQGTPYLHETCRPIGDIEFTTLPGYRQLDRFGNECEGLCGV